MLKKKKRFDGDFYFMHISIKCILALTQNWNNDYADLSLDFLSKKETFLKKIFGFLVFSMRFTREFAEHHGLTLCTQVMLIYYTMLCI